MAFDPNRSGRRLSLRGLRRPLGVTPRIVLAFAYILLLASVGFGLGEFGHLRTESRRDELRTTRELTALGAAYAGSVLDGPPNARARGLRRVARDVLDRLHRSGPDPLARVIIVREPLSPPASRRRGLDPTPPRVFADARASEDAASPRTEADWGTRPEIAAALDGTTTQVERHSNDLGASVVLTAAPIRVAGRPVGALRVTRSDDAVARAASGTIERHVDGLLRVGGVVLGLGVIVAWILARHLTGPIRRLEQTARHVAAGDYGGAAT